MGYQSANPGIVLSDDTDLFTCFNPKFSPVSDTLAGLFF